MVRLRSGNLKTEDNRVDLGYSDSNLRVVSIPDLNLNDEPNAVSSEEGAGESREVSKTEGTLNSSVCEGKVCVGDECKGTEVASEERFEVPMSNGNVVLKVNCAEIDNCSGILGQNSDLSEEGKDVRVEKLNGAVGLANSGTLLNSESMEVGLDINKSLENDKKEMVCQGEDKDTDFEDDTAIGEKSQCLQGAAIGGIDDDKQGVSVTSSEDGEHNSECNKRTKDCDSNLDKPLKSDSGAVKESHEKRNVIDSSEGEFDEADQGGRLIKEAKGKVIQVLGKVLRSRVVPANRLGEEAGGEQITASPNKRKRETSGPGDVAATMKNGVSKPPSDSKRLCSGGRRKRAIDVSNGKVLELNNVQYESKIEDGGANDTSLGSSQKKRKRGRPKKSIDHPEDQSVHVHQLQAVSEIEDEDVDYRSTLNMKKDIHQEQVSICRSEEDSVAVCKGEIEAGEVRKKLVGSSTQRRKSERSKRVVDYCEKEVVQRRKFSGCNMDNGFEDENEGLSSVKVASSKMKAKRGRPKKQEVNNSSPSNVCQNGFEDENEGLSNVKVASSKMKGKRGRPKKQEVNNSSPSNVCQNGFEDENEGLSNVKVASSKMKGKRGRPKKQEVNKSSPSNVCQNGFEDENKGLNNVKVASSKMKGKSRRPRKQEGNSPVKIVSYGNDMSDGEKIKASLITPVRQCRQEIDHHGKATDVVPSVEEISSAKKKTSDGLELFTSSKCRETSLTDNNLSVKRKRGETPGSLAAEKNLIRNQIVDMLLHAGWTIEYRPRNGRVYNDAVYVNRDGKTHWSVTKAYYSLQQEFEEGKTGSAAANSNISFTPLPEEVLSKLFRVVSKTRSDKNKKKKHKGDGDSSDEELTRDKHGSKSGAKSKHSAFKRNPAVRDGTQSKRRCALVARRSKGLNSESIEAIAYSGKHSIFAWLIDSGAVSRDGKVQYMNRRKTRTMLEGSITRDGICCHCCKEVFSVFEFEKHTGSKLGQPYENLLLENGQSILQCLLESWNKQDAASLKGFHSVNVDADDPNDDTCAICGDGGDLMCCDGCPSTFHNDCLNIEEVPSGEWHCVYCSCKFCGGAVTQITHFLDTAFSSLVTCCLCDQKYHQSCADEENAVHIKSERATFCGRNCEQIFEHLQTLIGAKSDLGDGFSWTLLQRFDVKGEANSLEAQKIENNSKLAVALSVMDECFVPIVDPRSGVNLIRHVVYNSGSNFRRLNFHGFYTIILEKGDEVISAASIRIHGTQLAEMPFIGTRNIYRRQGMCRRLLTAIELALSSLDVQNLVIPAIPELLNTWTSVFGFQPLEESIREEMKLMNMLVFAHTNMLQKPLSKHRLIEKGIASIEKSEVDDGSFHGSFDLNVVAPSIPESSSDERLGGCNAGECGGDVKSGMDSVGSDATDKVEGLPTPMEIIDSRVQNSALVVNAGDGCMIFDHPDPSRDDKGLFHTCSATVSAEEATKSAMTCGPINLDVTSTLEIHPDNEIALVKKTSEKMTLKLDLNLMEVEDNALGYNNSVCPTVVDPEKGEDGPIQPNGSAINTGDDCELGTVFSDGNTGNASVVEKLGLKSEVHEPSIPASHSETGVSSNGSLVTMAGSFERLESDSHVVCKSVTQMFSESSCNTSSVVAENTTSPALFLATGAPKVGS